MLEEEPLDRQLVEEVDVEAQAQVGHDGPGQGQVHQELAAESSKKKDTDFCRFSTRH